MDGLRLVRLHRRLGTGRWLGAGVIAPAHLLSTTAFHSPVITTGPVSVLPSLTPSATVVRSPTIILALGQTVSPTHLPSSSVVRNPAVITDPFTVYPATISTPTVVRNPTMVPHPRVLAPTFIPSATSLYTPNIVRGAVPVSPAHITPSTSVPSPTISSESNPPALVWSSDFNIDNDDVQTTVVVIDAHRKGIIQLVGVMVASGKRTGAPAMRAILDAYGLSDVPIGVRTTLTQADYDFYPTETRDLFGKIGETDSSYPDAATLYRQLAVTHSGLYIATGGALTCESAFLSSPADGISPLTGSQLITAQSVKLFAVGGRIGLTANEPNFDDDRAAAYNVCENWPQPIVFGAIPSDATTLMSPVKVRTDESRALNPARFAFSRGAATIPTGFLGSLTLNTPSGDIDGTRLSGDTIVIEEILDEIQGSLGSSFTRTATGKMLCNPSSPSHTFSVGTSPNLHRCLASRVLSGSAQQTKLQGWLDAISGPARVNLWKSSTSLYGVSDAGATITNSVSGGIDGSATASTITGSGWAGHAISNIRSFPSTTYQYVVHMKKTSGLTRFPALTMVFKNSTGTTIGDLIAEAGAVINTNTGVGYAASGGSAPTYGSHACTVSVTTAPSTLGPNYADYWQVVLSTTTPANTQFINIYIQAVAGNSPTTFTRDGSGTTGSVTVWGMGLYPESSYDGYLPTTDRASFDTGTGVIRPTFLAATTSVPTPFLTYPQILAPSHLSSTTLVHSPNVGDVLWHPLDDAVQPRVFIDFRSVVWSGSNFSSLANLGTEGGSFGVNGIPVKGTTFGSDNAIAIDTNSQYLSQTLSAFTSGSVYVFAVYKLTNLTANGLITGPGAWGSGSVLGIYAHIPAPDGTFAFGKGYLSNAPLFESPVGRKVSASVWNCHGFLLGPSLEERINGTSYTTFATSSPSFSWRPTQAGATPAYASGEWKFGNVDPNSPGFEGIDGELAYLLVYNTAPDSTLKQKLEGWAMHDIGQQSQLDASHPYKTTPP